MHFLIGVPIIISNNKTKPTKNNQKECIMPALQTQAPPTEVDGLLYKIGLNGFVFYFNGIEWLKSQKTPHEIKESAKREQKRKQVKLNQKQYQKDWNLRNKKCKC